MQPEITGGDGKTIVRALDGFSERVMRESGDKNAGQQLAKEALKIEGQRLDGKDQTRTQSQDQVIKQGQEQIKEQVKAQDLRQVNDRVRREDVNVTRRATTEWKKSNDGGKVSSEARKSTDNSDSGKTKEPPRIENETRRERNDAESRRVGERSEARRTELNEARRTEMTESRRTQERNEARRTEINEARRTAERSEARRTEMNEARRTQERNEARRNETKSADAPSLLDGRKWQKDGSGNFVAKDKDGRLITQDAKGKIVDYQSHVNQKHMANQDQMAFMSVLFCNPLMMMGMGAGLAIMDQAHASKTAKLAESLGPKFDGKQANKAANQTGYAGEMSRKALLVAQYTRPMESRELAQMNGLAGLKSAASTEREEQKKRDVKRKQASDERTKLLGAKASMPTDRYSMSTKKLLKTKRLIEEEIERVRGKASLEEVSRLYSQVEVLDKALKRLENF